VREYASSIYKGIQEEKAEAAAQAASTDAATEESLPAEPADAPREAMPATP
jgi:hypothetical protein